MMRGNENGMSPVAIHGVGGAALLALGVGAYMFVIQPVMNGKLNRVALEERMQADRERVATLEETRASLVETLERGQERLDGAGVSLLGLSGRNTRMGELTELAGACGLRLDSLQPGQATPGEMFTITPITMRGVGSYDDVARFLHRSVQSLPDVSTRSFRVTAQGSGEQRMASFEFDLAWYADPADHSGD